MKQVRSGIAVVCVLLVATPFTYAQNGGGSNPRAPQLAPEQQHWYSGITRDYESRPVAPVNVSNSARLDSLLRAGRLYLSLQDAIALSVENNLDVEIERYEFALADADLLRAKSGASTLGIPTTVLPGVSTGAGNLLGSVTAGIPSLGYVSPLGINGTSIRLSSAT